MKLYNFETEFLTTVTTFDWQMDLSQWHRPWITFVEKELRVSLPWGWSEQFPKPWNGFLLLNHIYLHTSWDSYNANKEECDRCGSSHFLQERLGSAQLSERKHENVIPLQKGSLSWLWDKHSSSLFKLGLLLSTTQVQGLTQRCKMIGFWIPASAISGQGQYIKVDKGSVTNTARTLG